MKPAAFDYATPSSVDEVLALLERDPEESSVLAGGQSLVPLLNMRMARPRLVVDLNGVEGLDAVEVADGGQVRLGSMVRQRRLEVDPELRRRLPLVAEAAQQIAHVAIRMRGTVGGSLAHADPAAELPATVTALGGRMLIRGRGGTRSVPADQFFIGPLTSAIEPGELLVGVELDQPPRGTGWAFVEVARTHGAFALAGAAALVRLDGAGGVESARLALASGGSAPYVPDWLEEMIAGEPPDESLLDRVGSRVRGELDPYDDVHASGDYRRHAAGVLTARALALAAERARGGVDG